MPSALQGHESNRDVLIVGLAPGLQKQRDKVDGEALSVADSSWLTACRLPLCFFSEAAEETEISLCRFIKSI